MEKETLHLVAKFDKTQQNIIFDFNADHRYGAYYGSDKDRIVRKIFGRMTYTEYRDQLYPFFPCFTHFSKAESVTHNTKVLHKIDTNEVMVAVDPEKTKAALIKALQKNLNANAGYVKNAIINNLKETESVATELFKSSIETEYEDEVNITAAIEQLVEEFKQKLEDTLKDKTVKFNIKKKIKTSTKTPYNVPRSVYHFHVDNTPVEIECTEQLAQVMHLLQPSLDYASETIKLIKKYRMFGVPESERTYNVQFIDGKKPYDHQWTMFKIAMRLKSFANLSQMGTGKTPATIMTIDQRIQDNDAEIAAAKADAIAKGEELSEDEISAMRLRGHIIYTAPAATLLGLQQHFRTYAPHLTTSIIDGNYMERFEKITDKTVDVKLINFEAFTMKVTVKNAKGEDVVIKFSDMVNCMRWGMCIIDEAHKIKNPDAQRTINILDTFKDVDYKIIMTGTITANKLYDIICPIIFLNNARSFCSILTQRDGEKTLTYGEIMGYILRSYFRKEGWGWSVLPGTVEELRSKLEEFSIRFEKSECMNLPAKVYETRLVELTPQQSKLYHDLELFLQAQLDDMLASGQKISVTHILALNMKLAEAANGWIYDNSGYPIKFPENPKVDAMLEVLDDIDDGESKVIIWSQFKEDMRMLRDAITKEYGYDSAAIIDGNVSFERRNEIANTFNNKDSKLRFVVCNVLAAGTGIDLIGASYEIYFSNSFRKVERSQSEDRAHRPGMQQHLTIIDIVAKGTIDEKVIGALKSNKSMNAALVENLGFDPKIVGDISLTEDAVIVENGNGRKKVHQKQYGPECMLAAIANAGNVKLDVVRQYILDKTGRTEWYPYTHEDVLDLMRKYISDDVANTWDTFHKYFYGDNLDYEAAAERRTKIRLDMTEVKVPTTGRCILFVDFEASRDTHIVYVEDGWVYDGNMEDRMECGKWLATLWDVKGKVCWKGEIS